MRLSNASGGEIDRATAPGTIKNAGPLAFSVNSGTATEGVDETIDFVTEAEPTDEGDDSHRLHDGSAEQQHQARTTRKHLEG